MLHSITTALQRLSPIEKALCIVMCVLVVAMAWVAIEEGVRWAKGKEPF